MVLTLNMADERTEKGVQIDTGKLSHSLQIPVVETVATRDQGFEELRQAFQSAAVCSLHDQQPFEWSWWDSTDLFPSGWRMVWRSSCRW